MLTRYPDLEPVLDLNFRPVTNERPAHFTRAQIDEYNERGYITPIPLFSGDELKRIQTHFLGARGPGRSEPPDLKELSLHNRDAGIYDVVTHPRTAAYLRDLLGQNVICHISQFINKPPGMTKGGSHHQDATFNAMHAQCVIVWLALEDAAVENGCMWFVPGSHRRGVVPCDPKHYVENPLSYGREEPCEVKAGHAVFMSDLVLHSSPANRSVSRSRPALTATYAAADNKPYKNAERWAVLCSGTDVNGYWHPQPRPAGPKLFGGTDEGK